MITTDLPGTTDRLQSALGLEPGYRDEGVGYFGLENRVLAAGDCFLEVLTPVTDDCTGARYLARRGGRDGGYMAIFQLDDRDAPRRRADRLGLRVVWKGDLDDISGTHLDPRDVGGAIVSLDWADPPESWHWAGPAWQRDAAASSAGRRKGGIRSLEVAVLDPAAVAARWAAVLGPGAELGGTSVELREACQRLDFVGAASKEEVGIVGCGLALEPVEGVSERWRGEVAGVRLSVVPEGVSGRSNEEVS